ncbi:biotin-dependent carboxyltransferase family protein [Maribacter sp. TH_r10]|uniref:Allophanate hydrolase subunit 2 family protein n=1 Tax=Maribacter luteus TaxID=2594478 RepID=A0A6I2MRM9_9FLAO|nr:MULTISPECIES: biotin-dependent carboxyltransferase family protein [Maribacter]MDV7139009.1 biotin-dependent carboxyltransferase family protein [Maribacter sp. TH_r10]MRX64864.1 allophanate hydrolase subunit 2 family protein [Maribacter luteus]
MLKVLKSGLYTTLQDEGRFGYRDKGVPVSGIMDLDVVRNANILLENETNAAVLEITMTGPTLLFEKATYIVMAGAEFSVTLNNEPLSNNKVHKVKAGDILSYGKLLKGFRGYLALKGGFQSKVVLGSRSQYFPITKKGFIKENTELPYEECLDFEPKISELKSNSFLDETVLMVSKGPEFKLLDDMQLEQLFINSFTVAKEYNRMGYQFNEKIKEHDWSMLTSATMPGTVQLTPSGKLIILMKDGQTTGGYPRILQLKDKAISILAQKKFGDAISFKLG